MRRVNTALLLVAAAMSLAISAADKPRVFITDKFILTNKPSAPARPWTDPATFKPFSENCQGMTLTSIVKKADYTITVAHPKSTWQLEVLKKGGDVLHSSDSQKFFSDALHDACTAIRKDMKDKKPRTIKEKRKEPQGS